MSPIHNNIPNASSSPIAIQTPTFKSCLVYNVSCAVGVLSDQELYCLIKNEGYNPSLLTRYFTSSKSRILARKSLQKYLVGQIRCFKTNFSAPLQTFATATILPYIRKYSIQPTCPLKIRSDYENAMESRKEANSFQYPRISVPANEITPRRRRTSSLVIEASINRQGHSSSVRQRASSLFGDSMVSALTIEDKSFGEEIESVESIEGSSIFEEKTVIEENDGGEDSTEVDLISFECNGHEVLSETEELLKGGDHDFSLDSGKSSGASDAGNGSVSLTKVP